MPPSPVTWRTQMQAMYFFDVLVDNIDRNRGNILIDSHWKVWWIDHTRTFSDRSSLRDPERIEQVERALWKRFRALSPETIEAALSPFLIPVLVEALLDRRNDLILLIESRIRVDGEGSVLFDGGWPAS